MRCRTLESKEIIVRRGLGRAGDKGAVKQRGGLHSSAVWPPDVGLQLRRGCWCWPGPAPGLTGFTSVLWEVHHVLPERAELTKSPWIPKVFMEAGVKGLLTLKRCSQGVGGWVAAGRRLHRDPEFLYAFVIMLKGGALGK